MFNKLSNRLSVQRALPKGRYDGANGTRGEDFQEQVDHATERNVQLIEQKASDRIRGLEAQKAHSEDRWKRANTRLNEILEAGRPKALVFGLALVVMFMAAICSEIYLLMPTMRGFGIADPIHQMFAAGGIVLMGAIVLKFLYSEARHYYALPPEEQAAAPNWKLQRILLPAVGILVITGFFLLGLFRASEMIFANELDPTSDLGRFVGTNDGLTKAVLVFLTVMLPVAGALALSHGIEIIGNWVEWARLRYLSWAHNRRIHHSEKELHAATEQLEKRSGAQREHGEEIKAEYRDGYNHGQNLGMHQLPVWFYVVKTLAVGLGVTFLMFLVDLWLQNHYQLPAWRWLFYVAGILFVTGLYGVRQWLARERPSENEVKWKPIWRDQETLAPVAANNPSLSSNGHKINATAETPTSRAAA